MEVKLYIQFQHLIVYLLFSTSICFILKYLPHYLKKKYHSFFSKNENQIIVVGIVVMIISLLIGILISHLRTNILEQILDLLTIFLLLAFMLFGKKLFSPRLIDLSNEKKRKKFAKFCTKLWKIDIKKNHPILIKHNIPFKPYSSEHTLIHCELILAHINTMHSILEKHSFFASWKFHYKRLIENSIFEHCLVFLAGIFSIISISDLLTLFRKYIMKIPTENHNISEWLPQNMQSIIDVITQILFIIPFVMFLYKDHKKKKQYYLDIMDVVRVLIEDDYARSMTISE